MINVTKTYLPPMAEYMRRLEPVWESRWLTNRGVLAKELEQKLSAYLGVPRLLFVSSGTIALQIAIKALDLKGEIITTAFSYVATTSSIVWEGCHPVFVDIDPETLCIDPEKIEEAITPATSAIIATHVYGIPCDVERIEQIARKHGLKVIYDAAHAFGVRYKGDSILNWGDISTLSFHATKLFHTVEGGGIVTHDQNLFEKVFYMHNFGHKDQEAFHGLGINGKNTEFHAAMGLCVLEKINEIIQARREVSSLYDKLLHGKGLRRPSLPQGTDYNYAYYPVIFLSEERLLECIKRLNAADIYPRRYFYPSLSKLPYIITPDHLSISHNISPRILCLPMFSGLKIEDMDKICSIVRQSLEDNL